MDHVDFFELRIRKEALELLSIMINIASDVTLDWTFCNFLDKLFAEILEKGIQRFIKLEAFLNRNLMHDRLILSKKLLILLEFPKIIMSERRSNTLIGSGTLFFFNLCKTRRLKLVSPRLSSLSNNIIYSLRGGRAATGVLEAILIDRKHASACRGNLLFLLDAA
jgi:hypothetical protein